MVKSVDFGGQVIESAAQRPGERVSLRKQGRPVRSQDAQIELAEEERDFSNQDGRKRSRVNVRIAAKPLAVSRSVVGYTATSRSNSQAIDPKTAPTRNNVTVVANSGATNPLMPRSVKPP